MPVCVTPAVYPNSIKRSLQDLKIGPQQQKKLKNKVSFKGKERLVKTKTSEVLLLCYEVYLHLGESRELKLKSKDLKKIRLLFVGGFFSHSYSPSSGNKDNALTG